MPVILTGPSGTGRGPTAAASETGNAVLSVAITGVGSPTETGLAEVPRGRVAVAETDVVTEAFFVGTTGRVPFRVYLLTGPARVVVEVAHP